jgi:hypothetical protein
MIIIIGLVILVVAVVVAVAGVLSNGGNGHALTHGFAVFGYHVTGSSGTLFLYGIVVGAIAVLGLSLLLAGARRTSRRGRDARRGLAQSRRETAAVSHDRDDLLGQRDTARAYTASSLGDDGTARSGSSQGVLGRLLGRRVAPRQAPAVRGQELAPAPPADPRTAPAAEPVAAPAGTVPAGTVPASAPADVRPASNPVSASAPAE